MDCTGPKISSRAIVMSSVTSANTVGWTCGAGWAGRSQFGKGWTTQGKSQQARSTALSRAVNRGRHAAARRREASGALTK